MHSSTSYRYQVGCFGPWSSSYGGMTGAIIADRLGPASSTKGESLHALRRDLLYAREGMVRARHLEAQTEQVWCLTPENNAVIAWTTEYYGLAAEEICGGGRRVDDDVSRPHLPAHNESINFFGAIEVDIDAEHS